MKSDIKTEISSCGKVLNAGRLVYVWYSAQHWSICLCVVQCSMLVDLFMYGYSAQRWSICLCVVQCSMLVDLFMCGTVQCSMLVDMFMCGTVLNFGGTRSSMLVNFTLLLKNIIIQHNFSI